MSDISESVLIQQSVQRLLRWHGAVPGRQFSIVAGDARNGEMSGLFACDLDDEKGEHVEFADTIHGVIDAVLGKVGAPV